MPLPLSGLLLICPSPHSAYITAHNHNTIHNLWTSTMREFKWFTFFLIEIEVSKEMFSAELDNDFSTVSHKFHMFRWRGGDSTWIVRNWEFQKFAPLLRFQFQYHFLRRLAFSALFIVPNRLKIASQEWFWLECLVFTSWDTMSPVAPLHFASPSLPSQPLPHSPFSSHISHSMKQISHGAQDVKGSCVGAAHIQAKKQETRNTFLLLHFSEG